MPKNDPSPVPCLSSRPGKCLRQYPHPGFLVSVAQRHFEVLFVRVETAGRWFAGNRPLGWY